jgi:hypothetical protein
MPMILSLEDEKKWLDKTQSVEDLKDKPIVFVFEATLRPSKRKSTKNSPHL